MTYLKVILLGGCALLTLACTAPESTRSYEPYFEGYAAREAVEPASYPVTLEPDTLLPGEKRIEVVEVPGRPADVDPPQNLDEEPVRDDPFPYGGWNDGFGRWRRNPVPHQD